VCVLIPEEVDHPAAMRMIVALKRARRRGASFPEIARRYSVSVGTAYKVTTTDLRVLRREGKAA